MAISLTICNLALGDVRAQPISDPGEETVEAQMCRRYYPHALDMLLDDYAWTFTKRVASLALMATNERATEWAYAYQLPSDCATALKLLPSGALASDYRDWRLSDLPPPSWWTVFIVENGVVYTNISDAVLEYAAKAADEAVFPPLFREALRRLLAANLAVPLRDDPALEVRLYKAAAAAREQAMAADMNRAPMREPIDDVAWARR